MITITISNEGKGISPIIQNFDNGKEAYEYLRSMRAKYTFEDSKTIFDVIDTEKKFSDYEIGYKRSKKYPPIAEVVEAIIEHLTESKDEKLNEIIAKRAAVKLEFPKINKELK